MQAPCDATLLRVFIGHDDTHEGRPLDEQIVLPLARSESPEPW